MLWLDSFITYGTLAVCFLFLAWHIVMDWKLYQYGTTQLNQPIERLDKLEAQHSRMENNGLVREINRKEFELIGYRHFYIERSNFKDWNSAKNSCREMGGYLASFSSRNEFVKVKGKLNSDQAYWLGINNMDKKDVFVSDASGKPLPFIDLSSEDCHVLGLSCVSFIHGGSILTTTKWNYQARYICQSDSYV